MMNINNKVVWYEGMALEPQHFQQQTQYFENLIFQKSRLLETYFWGFGRLKIDNNLLSIGKFGLLEACGVFPDGTFFDMPNTDEAPQPIDMPEGMNNTIFYLALPVSQVNVAEAGNEGSKQIARYHVRSKLIRNSMADSDEEVDVSVASLACRILTDRDDLSAYTILPIIKLGAAQANKSISLDTNFIPSYLDIQESLLLQQFIEEVKSLLSNRANLLASRLSDKKQSGASDVIDLILLQLSNKYEVGFNFLSHLKPLHPKIFYYRLIEMIAEMSTYTHPTRRPYSLPKITKNEKEVFDYNHNDLFTTFNIIIQESRHVLTRVLDQNAILIPLDFQGHGLWRGLIHDKSLLQVSSFVISVFSDLPLETIRSVFTAQVKIAALEKIQNFVSKGLPGIGLQAIAIAPRQIPYHANFAYFILEMKSDLGKEIQNSAGIGIHVGTTIPGLKFELWAIKDGN